MNKKLVSFIGILGVSLFIITSIIGGILIEDYSVLSQYISETYAIDTEYGGYLRFFGYMPAGLLIALYCFLGRAYFPASRATKTGFLIIGIFYGLATALISFFPCDSGCNKEFIDPSISQLLHNLIGLMTYLLVPLGMIWAGMGLQKSPHKTSFALPSIGLGVLSFVFVAIMVANTDSEYLGLIQRVIEACFALWIIGSAIVLKNLKTNN